MGGKKDVKKRRNVGKSSLCVCPRLYEDVTACTVTLKKSSCEELSPTLNSLMQVLLQTTRKILLP